MKILLMLTSLLLTQQAVRPEFGAVAGQIRAVDGSPAAAVRVAAMAIEENGKVDPAAATLASLGQTDSEGRFQLQNIPPGRYLITAGFLDSADFYPGVKTHGEARSITVTAGAAVTNIDFTLAVSSGVRVHGRVRNIPQTAPPGLIRVILQPVLRSPSASFVMPLDATLTAGGTFEVSRVPPGSYNLRMTPGVTPAFPVEVGDKDIDGLELTSPPMVSGRVTVEDGSPLPIQAAALAAGMADPPVLLRLQGLRVDRISTGGAGGTTSIRSDGTFLFPFPAPGDYMVTATLMPLGYYIKSMTYGTVNVIQSPLQLGEESGPTELQVVLTKTPPAGTPAGVTVSGRLLGLENTPGGSPAFVSLQSQAAGENLVPSIRVGETPARPDGSFEITGVPPGRYSVRSVSGPGQIVTIDVTNQDVSGLEIRMTNPALSTAIGTTLAQAAQIQARLPATLSVSQSGSGALYRDGAVTFFRVEFAGNPLDDKNLDGSSASFALTSGNYELRSYVRPCNGNCDRLDPPRDECVAPFTLNAGQTLHAERVMQGAACTIQFRQP